MGIQALLATQSGISPEILIIEKAVQNPASLSTGGVALKMQLISLSCTPSLLWSALWPKAPASAKNTQTLLKLSPASWLCYSWYTFALFFFPTAIPLKTTLCSVSAVWSSPNPKKCIACPFFGALGQVQCLLQPFYMKDTPKQSFSTKV